MASPVLLTEFHCLSELPTELRLKIWSFALKEPRAVQVTCVKAPRSFEERYASWFQSTTKAPPLLHINQEARFEALQIYTRGFETNDSPRYTYVSYPVDIVHCKDTLLEYLVPADLANIEHLDVITGDSAYFAHFHMETLQKMEKLRELDLHTKRGEVYSWNQDRFVENLAQDFEQGRHDNPGWVCPKTRIFNVATGGLDFTIEGGALVPGWKRGDAHPDYPEDD